jgi:hypothetical protein
MGWFDLSFGNRRGCVLKLSSVKALAHIALLFIGIACVLLGFQGVQRSGAETNVATVLKERAETSSLGAQRVAVLLFKYESQVFPPGHDPSLRMTPACMQEILYTRPNSLDKYVREASYGNAHLAPLGAGSDVFGWFTFDNCSPAPPDCTTPTSDADTYARLDTQFLVPNQIKLRNYRHVISMTPTVCGNSSNVGITNSVTATGYHFIGGDFEAAFTWVDAMNQDDSTLDDKLVGPTIFRHEFSHGLDLTPNAGHS